MTEGKEAHETFECHNPNCDHIVEKGETIYFRDGQLRCQECVNDS